LGRPGALSGGTKLKLKGGMGSSAGDSTSTVPVPCRSCTDSPETVKWPSGGEGGACFTHVDHPGAAMGSSAAVLKYTRGSALLR
jgi:hypothetical protein